MPLTSGSENRILNQSRTQDPQGPFLFWKSFQEGRLKQAKRLKLYPLLALNCGMISVDIGKLLKNDLDTKSWRIKRKRTKTEAHDVPEVDYKLWPETAQLLAKNIDPNHPEYVLTSKTRTPLWERWRAGRYMESLPESM